MVLNFRNFLFYDVKLLTMEHGRNLKSIAPSHGENLMEMLFPWTSLQIYDWYKIRYRAAIYFCVNPRNMCRLFQMTSVAKNCNLNTKYSKNYAIAI